ncbi:hypothetical protein QCA50_008147 [Cerrena zonata]|uniref:Uncharacterized protein n=1 Tax=Cerrena zonata TaxID=2478898 RepID=A0AAW0GBC5_9APHY
MLLINLVLTVSFRIRRRTDASLDVCFLFPRPHRRSLTSTVVPGRDYHALLNGGVFSQSTNIVENTIHPPSVNMTTPFDKIYSHHLWMYNVESPQQSRLAETFLLELHLT